MKHLNRIKVGVAMGLVIGFWHFLWSCFVALGWAQGLLNWVLKLHFLSNPYQIAGFSLGNAAELVIVTACIGFLVGYLFAITWNWLAEPNS